MTNMILVYITCPDMDTAQKIGKHLLDIRAAACINIIPGMQSRYFWPPMKNILEEAHEVILICKTIKSKWQLIEKETIKTHPSTTPCIVAIPVSHATDKYYQWIANELK